MDASLVAHPFPVQKTGISGNAGLASADQVRCHKRLIIKKGKEFFIIPVGRVAYFFLEDGFSFLVEKQSGEKYMITKPLRHLQLYIDSLDFFRISKKYLVNINSISKFRQNGKGKIEVLLNPDPGEKIILSQVKGHAFKKWIVWGDDAQSGPHCFAEQEYPLTGLTV